MPKLTAFYAALLNGPLVRSLKRHFGTTYLSTYTVQDMELFRQKGATGLPDNFPIQQKYRVFVRQSNLF